MIDLHDAILDGLRSSSLTVRLHISHVRLLTMCWARILTLGRTYSMETD